MVNESPSARNLSGMLKCSSLRELSRKDPVTDFDLIIIGERKYPGRGVSYCAVCDGPFLKGGALVFRGGGAPVSRGAFSLPLSPKKLSVVPPRNDFPARATLQPRLLKRKKVEPITPAE